jgi:hypothetical protein
MRGSMVIYNSKFHALFIILAISSCTGSSIGNNLDDAEKYFGCYRHNDTAILEINRDYLLNLQTKEKNNVINFQKIRDSDYVILKNSMYFFNNNLIMGAEGTRFQYKLLEKESKFLLITHDEMGKNVAMEKIKNKCD